MHLGFEPTNHERSFTDTVSYTALYLRSSSLVRLSTALDTLAAQSARVPLLERSNCRARSCNHTFVADSFEKRDDFCIAQKFSDEFLHLLGLTDILSRTPDPDSHPFQDTNCIIGGPQMPPVDLR